MLVIRLTRTGKKNAASFRIVVIEKTAPPKSGRFLEILGNYNPRLPAKGGSAPSGKELNLKKERIEYWLSQGAQASAAVYNLLVNQGIIKGPKIKKKIRNKKKEEKSSEGGSAPEGKEEKEIQEVKEETPVKEDFLPKTDAPLEQTSDKEEEVVKRLKKRLKKKKSRPKTSPYQRMKRLF